MYLHDICRSLTVVLAAMMIAPPAAADETLSGMIVAASQSAVEPAAPHGSIWLQIDKITASFCGACSNSNHNACGGQSNGWSCCSAGCSDSKMQCWNVSSCDKIAGRETVPQLPVHQDGSERTLRRPDMLVAQSDQCTSWYNNIQAELSSFNSQCSGELPENQYAYCVSWQSQINADIASYNNQCG